MSENERGFIKIYRQFFDHHLWNNNREFSKAEAWIWILKEARYKPGKKKMFINDKLIEWGHGEIPASVRFLKEAWGWGSKTKVSNFLKHLENEDMIIVKKGQAQNVISICNYSTYNDTPKGEKDSEKTLERQQKDSEKTLERRNSKKGNKGKKGKKGKKKYRARVHMKPKEFEKLCEKHDKPFVEECLDKLNNYKISKGKKYKSDYRAILSWVVQAVQEDQLNRQNDGHKTKGDRRIEQLQDFTE